MWWTYCTTPHHSCGVVSILHHTTPFLWCGEHNEPHHTIPVVWWAYCTTPHYSCGVVSILHQTTPFSWCGEHTSCGVVSMLYHTSTSHYCGVVGLLNRTTLFLWWKQCMLYEWIVVNNRISSAVRKWVCPSRMLCPEPVSLPDGRGVVNNPYLSILSGCVHDTILLMM